jgi:hypothetical protein
MNMMRLGVMEFVCIGGIMIVPAIIVIVLIFTLRGKSDNGLAILSLITSILGFFLLPIVGSIAGIVSGNIALSQYKLLTQPNGNEGLAKAGVILGWIGLGLWLIGGIGIFLFLVPTTRIVG